MVSVRHAAKKEVKRMKASAGELKTGSNEPMIIIEKIRLWQNWEVYFLPIHEKMAMDIIIPPAPHESRIFSQNGLILNRKIPKSVQTCC